jgi:hypothetical protein
MRLTLFCRHSDFIKHLEAEVAWYREQMIHERQRAELALDELLRVRVGVGPVTLPTPAEAAARETAVDRLLKDTEFTTAGVEDGCVEEGI